jgi:putative peptidoglycan lipid II flippase
MIKENKKEYSILLIMIAMTLLSKFLGLYRDMLMASSYGVSMETDAFFVASRIPTYFFDFALSAAVVSTFIPIFNQIKARKDNKEAFIYANQFMSLGILLALISTLLLLVFPQVIVRIFGPGLNKETLEYAAVLTRVMSPVVIFAFITYTYVGLLQSFEHFNIAAIISVFSNLAVIIYMLFFSKDYGLTGLAVAFTIGWLIQSLVQLPVMKKEGYQFKFNFHWKNPSMKKTLSMSLPALIITWAQPLSTLISSVLASFYSGGVTVMEYAMRVFIIVTGVLVYSITNYIFPKLSTLYDPLNLRPFKEMAERTLRFFIYFALPVTLLLSYFSLEVVEILFLRGEFTPEQAALTGLLLRGLSFGLLGTGVREILNRIYFAIGDTKTPLKVTIIGLIFNVVLALLMSHLWGLRGLAFAVALTMILTSAYQWFLAWRTRVILLTKDSVVTLLKIIFVDLLLLATLVFLNIHGQGGILLKLIMLSVTGLLFMFLHIVILKLLKVSLPQIKKEL